MKRRWMLRFALLAGAFAGVVLCFEVCFRSGWVDFYATETRRFNPELANVLGRERPRILLLGDSFCATENGWQDHLRARLAPDVDLINLSVPGAGFHEYRQRARTWVARLKPRLILVGAYVGNDLWNACNPYPDRSLLRGTYHRLSHHLQVLKWVNSRIVHLPFVEGAVLGPTIAVSAERFGSTPGYIAQYARDYPRMVHDAITLPPEVAAEQLARIDALMGDIVGAGARVALVLIPSSAQVDRRYYPEFYQRVGFVSDPAVLVGNDRVQRELGRRARAFGIEVLDPLSAMRASADALYYLDNDHLSPRGQAWLCDWMVAQDLKTRVTDG